MFEHYKENKIKIPKQLSQMIFDFLIDRRCGACDGLYSLFERNVTELYHVIIDGRCLSSISCLSFIEGHKPDKVSFHCLSRLHLKQCLRLLKHENINNITITNCNENLPYYKSDEFLYDIHQFTTCFNNIINLNISSSFIDCKIIEYLCPLMKNLKELNISSTFVLNLTPITLLKNLEIFKYNFKDEKFCYDEILRLTQISTLKEVSLYDNKVCLLDFKAGLLKDLFKNVYWKDLEYFNIRGFWDMDDETLR